ncbi:BcsR/BcsP family cellulose biosynthesis protein [Plesiomonas sp.]|uniref:BcsR/BcsP family cellulose biosynthesis protein n=1 Tax=Plesiomonas sp. TaxID=2486279 RepID=UPI003F34EFFC
MDKIIKQYVVGDDVANLIHCYNMNQMQYLEVKDIQAIKQITQRWPLLAESIDKAITLPSTTKS